MIIHCESSNWTASHSSSYKHESQASESLTFNTFQACFGLVQSASWRKASKEIEATLGLNTEHKAFRAKRILEKRLKLVES
jgi:hypothetical protein